MVELPIPLHLGMPQTAVLTTLGEPTSRLHDAFLYMHQHEETINNEPYTSINSVIVVFRDGALWAIEVQKTTAL